MKNTLTAILLCLSAAVMAQAPNWSVNPNSFQYSMIVTAVVDVNCVELANPGNKLAAFHQGSIRGTAQTLSVVNGRYTATMSVYSNQVNGEYISFEFYDVVGDSVYVTVDSVIFQDNAVYGSPNTPLSIKTNNRPTAVLLSNDTIQENSPSGQIVAQLSTSDLDVLQSHSYALVSGAGSTNNNLFSLNGNQLLANFVADYEAKSSYDIRIKSTDSEGCFIESAIALVVKDQNDAPTSLTLGNNQIDENSPQNSAVGVLSAVDQDANEVLTFSLASGLGDVDNSLFNINGSNLRINQSFNYEQKQSYKIRVRVTDAASNVLEDTLTIYVNDLNDVPTDIVLSKDSVFENSSLNSIVALLSTVDEDAGQSFTYSFSSVPGNDNDSFLIVGNQLRSNHLFDFERRTQYFIYITTSDLNGGTYTEQVTIRIADANDVPTQIDLSNESVNENMPIGTFVAKIYTTDQDLGQAHSYSFTSGVGDGDNGNFSVSNDTLFTNLVLDLNAQATHNIRLLSNDGNGGAFSKTFMIRVKDINNVPTDISISTAIIPENTTIGAEVCRFATIDADLGDIHAYSFVSGAGDADNGSFTINGNQLLNNTTFDVNLKTAYSIRVQSNDGFGGVFQKSFSFTIVNSNDPPTNIILSYDSISESLPTNTLVGLFSTIDPDAGDVHSYSFVSGTNDNSSFVVVGNELRSTQTFNYEQKNSYFILLQSNDGNGGTLNKQFTIHVKDTADGPTDISIDNLTISENQPANTFLGVLSSTDEDASDTFSYQLALGANSADNGSFQISNDSLFSSISFDYEAKNSHNIRIRSTDLSNLYTEKAFVVSIQNANDAPIGLTISNTTVSESTPLNTGIGVFTTQDPDTGNTHTYSLVPGIGDIDNDDFYITGNALITDTVFDINRKSIYSIRVKTTDAAGGFYERIFVINIANANDAPTDISLNPAQLKENKTPYSLVGNFSTTDPDANDVHVYTFANLSSNDNASFTIVGSELRALNSFDFETKSRYFVQVQSSDGNGGNYSKQILVNVLDSNDAPTDIILSANSVSEKQSPGVFIGKLASIDQDAVDTYSYSLVSGQGDADNGKFSILNDSLFSNASFDVLVQNQLNLRVQTTDALNRSYQKAFVVYVQDVNDAPIDILINNSSSPENTAINSVIGSFSTTDIDPNQTFSYLLSSGSGDADNGNFTIVGNDLKSNVVFDYNNKRKHFIRVKSTDQGGLSFEKQFLITITNSNDAPSDISISPNSFKENIALSSIVGSFSSTDKDSTDNFSYSFVNGGGTNDNSAFIISGNQLRTSASYDFETKNLYVIEVKTTDNGGLNFTRQITLNVLDSNDKPMDVLLSNDSIFEYQPKGTYVGDLSTNDVDANDQFTYALVSGQGSADNALFRISGQILESDSSLNFTNKAVRTVRIRSTDLGGESVERSFTIKVLNQNDAPTDIQLSDTSINEVAAVGTRVGTLSATDADKLEVFTYSLVAGTGDTDNAAFTINGSDLISNASFDFESQSVYSIRLRVNDIAGDQFEKAFLIAISNGNEAPVMEEQLFSIAENSSINTLIGTVIASDVDQNEVFSFRLINQQSLFSIDQVTGNLFSRKSYDYEIEAEMKVLVEVRDSGNLNDTAEVTVEVLDMIEGSLPAAGYFSPNGDGINDFWHINNAELYSNYKLQIFAASGELVFQKASNYTNDWDGTMGGSKLPEGIYYYLLENNSNGAQLFKGIITLKR